MATLPSKLKKTMTKTNSKIVHAIAKVMEQNPWEGGQRPDESKRMYHDRVAQTFGLALSIALRRDTVVAWAIYGGEDEYAWEYGVRVGTWAFSIKRPRPE